MKRHHSNHSDRVKEVTVRRVGQGRLKRTVYPDAACIRLYLDRRLLFRISTVAHYCECTPDELIRDTMSEFLDKCDQNFNENG